MIDEDISWAEPVHGMSVSQSVSALCYAFTISLRRLQG